MELLQSFILFVLTGAVSYLYGLLSERRQIKWKENRKALQVAYGYCDIYLARIKIDEPVSDLLFEQGNQLKYNHIFNVEDKTLFHKLHHILEMPIYDNASKTYNQDLKQEFIKLLEEILPLLKQALK